ncbi:MAG: acyltransferase [Roseiarcus sp.]|jgi:peptidoglycan/LPS O-acetylase OafA/YrhL
MRISLAACVLFWHSYGISYGTEAANSFWRTPAGFILELILPMFFCLSGFLVSGSLERNRDLRKFLALRAIRIYPALCVEVFVSALILGSIVTSTSLIQYVTSRQFFSYFMNTIGWIHYLLPGVFLDNPMQGIVNISLWTVPYELECYIVLPILVLIGFMRSRTISLAMFVACTILVIGLLHRSGETGTPLGGVHGRVLVLCFLAGAIIFRFRELLPYSGRLALAAAAFAIVMLRYKHSVCFAPIFVAYVTVYLGMRNPRRTLIIDSGDYSYGVYLYAAPFQQTVAWALGPANNWALNVAVALPATVLFALFSWHAVERPFLKVKRHVSRQRRDAAA